MRDTAIHYHSNSIPKRNSQRIHDLPWIGSGLPSRQIERQRVRLLRGERMREFVLSHKAEQGYLHGCPQPLRDVAILMLETGVRPGEATGLQWTDVRLLPAVRAKFGYIQIRSGKSCNAKRNLSLTARAAELLKNRKARVRSSWVFPGDNDEAPILGTSLDHQHEHVRRA